MKTSHEIFDLQTLDVDRRLQDHRQLHHLLHSLQLQRDEFPARICVRDSNRYTVEPEVVPPREILALVDAQSVEIDPVENARAAYILG